MSKQKLSFSLNTDIDDEFEDIDEEIISNINSDKKDLKTENKLQTTAQEATKKIERLFPSRHDISIPLEELTPAPDDWNFFQLPDIETLKLIAESIYYQGQLAPALVWKQPNGQYMILGGHTRYAVLKVLKNKFPEEKRFNTMSCHVYEYEQLDENSAKYIIITNNMTQRAQEAPSIQVKCIVKAMELQKRIKKETWGEVKGRSAEIVASSLGISQSKANKYYKLRKLIPGFLYILDEGNLPIRLALSLAEMPELLQKYILEKEYYSISDSRLKHLLKSKTIEDIDAAVKSDEKYIFNGQALTYEVPKDFKKINLAVDKEDEDMFKNALLNLIGSLEFKNDTSKRLLLDVLFK